ncbi:myb/SANT-like DNA-binding domain-containing protein 4 [Procambarus clarkii]|uniref:myb/SANT-like DNA-binding domain-containing protein 4 n=1 Tax=Procambarus clarkii TaxID=6728 RepID=UPI001E67873C|nr:myb/SANT-like DNA-binding domain-containing protein 4 isoform X1 [Procambarus clarkii]
MEVRKRKARFSVHEIDVLVDEVYRNRATLFSRLCSTITNEKKMVIWQSITEKVNEVCTVQPRTADEVRRKWYYYLSDRKKEVSRRNKLKKTDCHSPDVIYNQTDLKILELLGEIDGVDRTVEGAVEGLICEVDADALPIRPSSASSYFNEHEEHQEGSRTSSGEVLASRLPDHPLATQEEREAGAAPPTTSPPTTPTIKKESVYFNHDTFSPTITIGEAADTRAKQTSTKRTRTAGEDSDLEDREDQEFLQLEKRRVYLQECQLRLLHDIYKQMQTDSERNHAFQQAFLDIERQRLELEKAASHK